VPRWGGRVLIDATNPFVDAIEAALTDSKRAWQGPFGAAARPDVPASTRFKSG
jgi:hypothetical protein